MWFVGTNQINNDVFITKYWYGLSHMGISFMAIIQPFDEIFYGT